MDNLVLPFVFHQNENVIPVNDGIKLKRNDRVTFLINLRRKKMQMTGSSEMDGELPHCENLINLEVRSSNFYLC